MQLLNEACMEKHAVQVYLFCAQAYGVSITANTGPILQYVSLSKYFFSLNHVENVIASIYYAVVTHNFLKFIFGLS